jgi:hypothetical protein
MQSVFQPFLRILVAIFLTTMLAFAPAAGGLAAGSDRMDLTLSTDGGHGAPSHHKAMPDCQSMLTCFVREFRSSTTNVEPSIDWTLFVPSPPPSDRLRPTVATVELRPPRL